MELGEALGLVVAAAGASVVNAVAGGGSLISFPALLIAGYPAKTANVTNTIAIWPGTVGGSLGYRKELSGQRIRLLTLLVPSIGGAIAGSAILLSTPESAFDAVVPFLIIFACAVMAFQDRLSRFPAGHTAGGDRGAPLALQLVIFLTAIYGAYFGAGFGIITLAMLGVLISDNIQNLNALKGMLSSIVNAIAFVYFAFFGPVEWGPAFVMMGGALAGGYLGAIVARRLPRNAIRILVVVYGLVIAGVLLAT